MQNNKSSTDYGSPPSYGSDGTAYGPENKTKPQANETKAGCNDQNRIQPKNDRILKRDVGTQSQHLNPSTHESSSKTDKNKFRK